MQYHVGQQSYQGHTVHTCHSPDSGNTHLKFVSDLFFLIQRQLVELVSESGLLSFEMPMLLSNWQVNEEDRSYSKVSIDISVFNMELMVCFGIFKCQNI